MRLRTYIFYFSIATSMLFSVFYPMDFTLLTLLLSQKKKMKSEETNSALKYYFVDKHLSTFSGEKGTARIGLD